MSGCDWSKDNHGPLVLPVSTKESEMPLASLGRLLLTAIFLAGIAGVVGCGQKDTPSRGSGADSSTASKKEELPIEEEAKVKLIKLDLTPAGLPLIMDAPEGATAKDVVGAEVRVSQGDHFDLFITHKPEDMAELKKAAKENKVAPFIQAIVDKPDEFVYECEVFSRKVTRFELNVRAGENTHTVKDGRGPNLTRADIEFMVKCAKSIAPK
jgi:hypothetical protein